MVLVAGQESAVSERARCAALAHSGPSLRESAWRDMPGHQLTSPGTMRMCTEQVLIMS